MGRRRPHRLPDALRHRDHQLSSIDTTGPALGEGKLADGNPDGVSKVTGESTDLDGDDLAALDHLAERMLQVSGKLLARAALTARWIESTG